MAIDNLRWTTLVELASLIRDGEVSSTEVVESTLQHISATEPTVHAFAGLMSDSARAEAAEADSAIARGDELGPLHGIPVGVKDLCHTAGFVTAGGSKVLEGFVPETDATVVRKLRRAGAVIVGKTVTHEFAYGQNIPPTRNAWDQSCYPGGSSAGSGVSLAVGDVWGAIGTDTGGSVRAPASVNGVVGLKPTHDLVGRKGVLPMSPTLDTVGPMARTVRDCATLLSAIAGSEPGDETATRSPLPDYARSFSRDVSKLKIGVERDYFFYAAVDPEVAKAVDEAIALIESLGVSIVEVEIPNLDLVVPAGLAVLLADTSEWHQPLLREKGDRYVKETRLMLELGEITLATSYARAQKVRSLIRESVRSVFDENDLDAIAAPSSPVTTMPVEQLSVDLTGTGETALSALLHHGFPANVIGIPALSVPVGFSSKGLPIGMQLIGRPFGESPLFTIGDAYQSTTDWHLRHPEWVESKTV